MNRRILTPIALLFVGCVSGQSRDDGGGGSAGLGAAGSSGSAGAAVAMSGAGGASVGGSAAGLGGANGGLPTGGATTMGGSGFAGAGGVNASGNSLGGAAGSVANGGMSMSGMSTGGSAMGGSAMGGSAMGGSAMGGSAMGGSAMGGASCMEAGQMVGMTAAHNAARAMEGANLAPLTWDCTVAAYAQTYANKLRDEQGCWNLIHSGGPYGENLYASGSKPNPPNSSPQDVVDSWYGEKANYNYAANTCSDVCGHYTQVVWGSTARVGCGVATCPANADGWLYEVWVCDYDPPGNVNGNRPY